MTVIVPVLGDQLTRDLASLRCCDKADTVVLMVEVIEEATYVRHHKAKIAMIFSALRHFAADLRADGWQVDYTALDDPGNAGSFTGELLRAVERHGADLVRVVEPGEWRVEQAMRQWELLLPCPVDILPDDRFLCSRADFARWAEDRKELRMEWFYRDMRRRTGLLMDGKEPEGGRWNFDADNRGAGEPGLTGPALPRFEPDTITRDCIALVAERFADHFGSLDHFNFAVTAAQAEVAVTAFLNDRLPLFGRYQDVMAEGQDFLFHAILSPAINLGLIDVLDLCRRAEAEYRAGRAPLNAVEGFIRQIIGWREYVRGVYWLDMPRQAEDNFLKASRPLPEFYWTGETDMACLADCVRATRDHAYAHHIQRLMVLGNFALLAGIVPQDVEDWFLVVYADAYEWVELPNVAGMALFADGGRLASKPYAASGAYIDRMSDYCRSCRYDVKQKTGPDACPFNALYWHFLARNEDKLGPNPRLRNPFATWRRMSEEKQRKYLASADAFLHRLEAARPGWARGDHKKDA